MVLRAFIMFRKTVITEVFETLHHDNLHQVHTHYGDLVITEVFETLHHDNLHQVHTHYGDLGPKTFRSKESLMKKMKF